jgi:hypothetical protein
MNSKIQRAEELGTQAFEQGYTRIFHIHGEAIQLLGDLQFGDPESLAIMKAWYRGWDKKNIDAPLPR